MATGTQLAPKDRNYSWRRSSLFITLRREHNPPSCSRHLGQVVWGCVTLWRQSCLTPPPSPTLLASWEIADRHPNQTICPTWDCCHVLTEIAGQPGTDFSHRGERSTLFTVYNTLYTHLAGSFWVSRQNHQQVAPNQEKPHTTPLHSLIYSIYISVVQSRKKRLKEGKAKCRLLKKLTCTGTLRHVFICLRFRTPYHSPPYTHCTIYMYMYTVHLFTQGTGRWGEFNQREA